LDRPPLGAGGPVPDAQLAVHAGGEEALAVAAEDEGGHLRAAGRLGAGRGRREGRGHGEQEGCVPARHGATSGTGQRGEGGRCLRQARTPGNDATPAGWLGSKNSGGWVRTSDLGLMKTLL